MQQQVELLYAHILKSDYVRNFKIVHVDIGAGDANGYSVKKQDDKQPRSGFERTEKPHPVNEPTEEAGIDDK